MGTKVLRANGYWPCGANENYRHGRNSSWSKRKRDEVAERQPAQDRRRTAYLTHADSEHSHGVDGSDELASSLGKSAGGVRVAGGFFGAADARHAALQETQYGG